MVASGTEVLFPSDRAAFIFVSEQFWGRAARASSDSRESGRLLIFGVNREIFSPEANGGISPSTPTDPGSALPWPVPLPAC